jgi:hypothetical protein
MSETGVRRYTEITTVDTKQTYRFDGEKNQNPQLWAIVLETNPVDAKTGYDRPSQLGGNRKATVYVERQTLVNTGLLPEATQDNPVTEETKETVEDLILRIVDMLGIQVGD